MFDNAGYRPGRKPENATQEAILAFHVALRTGMRRGEVLQLGARTLDLGKRVAVVEHKTQHDSRATALTHMSRKVPVQVLSRISGHKDIRILVNRYYRESAEDIVKRFA
ncbi:phage integrase family protein [mine drainage metagenome]|uniref:Phage integrase family protein n=1 Tax=mine drainage metagenome TaxID=410659 RepID=A0A1J5RGA2_9ZZZZ